MTGVVTVSKVPPVRVARAAGAVRTGLQGLTRRMVPPPVAMLELITGFLPAQAVYAAARLGIADVLADGPRSAEEISEEIGTDADATHRLLRACASFGVFTQDGHGRFGLNPLASSLRSGVPDSVRPIVLMLGDPLYQAPWGQLAYSVKTGAPAAEKVHGKPMWSLLEEETEFASIFDDAMTCLTALDWPAVAAAYDFARFSTIVDVGGGHGQLLALMLAAAPDAKGMLLERPEVVRTAERHLADAGVLARCRLESGSFFEAVPPGGDLYVLRRVIHDWDDGPAGEILRTVRRSMSPESRLLVMESIVPPGNGPDFAKAVDLDMLIFVSGRERTETQFRTLLHDAGFRITRIVATVSAVSLIEAMPEGLPEDLP